MRSLRPSISSCVVSLLALAGLTCLDGCAETQGARGPHAASSRAVSSARSRVAATTITLPPFDTIPAGAPTIDVPDTAGGRAGDRAKGAPPPSAVDDLLGAAPEGTNAEAVVRTSLYPRARACYTALLGRDPSARGRVVVALEVRMDGSVAASTAEISVGLPRETAKCIESSAKKLVFVPPGRRGAHLTVPMSFAPDDDRSEPGDGDAVQRDVVPIVLACYAAAREAGGSGGIDFVVKVGEGGAALDVTGARDASVGAGVAECATEKLRALHFDAAAGREIIVPIELRHASETPPPASP